MAGIDTLPLIPGSSCLNSAMYASGGSSARQRGRKIEVRTNEGIKSWRAAEGIMSVSATTAVTSVQASLDTALWGRSPSRALGPAPWVNVAEPARRGGEGVSESTTALAHQARASERASPSRRVAGVNVGHKPQKSWSD